MLKKTKVYFVGIGGIGMSALARYFHQIGLQVAGYDKTVTDLTKRLQAEGISVSYIEDADAIPFPYREKSETLVIYTPAIPKDNLILNYFQENQFECIKRAEALGRISATLKTIAVAGTHGKTTVSSMVAFLMVKCKFKVSGFLGGISRNFGTNLILDPTAEYMVTEADEFDRSFLSLNPERAVITSVDSDHLDIYEDEEDVLKTYSKFASQITKSGKLYTKIEVEKKLNLDNQDIVTYGFDSNSDAFSKINRIENGKIYFDFQNKKNGVELKNITCGLPGKHNVENATVALTLLSDLGADMELAGAALSQFTGVKRRFDVHINREDFIYIDDYAHHPEEIKALISSVRDLYPSKKITAIFQPHLYSRTRDFGPEFAQELSKVDDLILLELYPAREEPIDGISSRWLSSLINKENVPVCQKALLINVLKSRNVELLLTIGAGDIDTMVDPIISYYDK